MSVQLACTWEGMNRCAEPVNVRPALAALAIPPPIGQVLLFNYKAGFLLAIGHMGAHSAHYSQAVSHAFSSIAMKSVCCPIERLEVRSGDIRKCKLIDVKTHSLSKASCKHAVI